MAKTLLEQLPDTAKKPIGQQVVSKQRVADHGEVYTNPREVNAMLDLVKQETARIESRFLEPACGTGNFLVEILNRKLSVVAERYARSRLEYERYAVLAISSIYGVDILARFPIDSEFAKISDSGRIESIINEPADEAADIIEKKISI